MSDSTSSSGAESHDEPTDRADLRIELSPGPRVCLTVQSREERTLIATAGRVTAGGMLAVGAPAVTLKLGPSAGMSAGWLFALVVIELVLATFVLVTDGRRADPHRPRGRT